MDFDFDSDCLSLLTSVAQWVQVLSQSGTALISLVQLTCRRIEAMLSYINDHTLDLVQMSSILIFILFTTGIFILYCKRLFPITTCSLHIKSFFS